MSDCFGPEPAQTRAPFGDTLTAGGGWSDAPPGSGRALERPGAAGGGAAQCGPAQSGTAPFGTAEGVAGGGER
jgi:hypothetical protein